jgi:hypothetical protein
VSTDVAEEHITSIFRVKEYAEQETILKQVASRAQNMEGICSSETSVHIQRTTRRYIPENSTVHRLRVFENRVLREIFGPKRDEVK